MEFNRAYDPIRALQSSWMALSRSPLPLMVGGVLLTIFDGNGGGSAPIRIEHHHHVRTLHDAVEVVQPMLPLFGICCCFGIALFLFGSWIRVGFANTVESVQKRGRATVGQLFESKG